jgi:hypothetical protein
MDGTRRWKSTIVGLHSRETLIQKQCERCAETAWADIDSDHNLLVAKICTRLKKSVRFQKRTPQRDLEKLYTQKHTVHHTLEGKLGIIECESGNVEGQWNNTKECVLDILRYLVGKIKKRASKL